MKKKNAIKIMFVGVITLLTSCSVNLLPATIKNNPNSNELENKGKEILAVSNEAHGTANLLKHDVYQLKGTDDWQGMMGGMGKLWPQKNTEISIKYGVNTFDAQLAFESGKTEQQVVGLQSWNYYEVEDNKPNFDVKDNDRNIFGMAAYQYFSELIGRMAQAEVIRYVEEKEFNGQQYDVIYVTWHQEAKDKEVDQYILYINKQTHLLDYVTYTIRDNYLKMPGANLFHGSTHFSDYRNIDGYMVPFTHTVFMNDPKTKESKYLHQLKLKSFTFDSFDKSELYPNESIESVGDSKEGK